MTQNVGISESHIAKAYFFVEKMIVIVEHSGTSSRRRLRNKKMDKKHAKWLLYLLTCSLLVGGLTNIEELQIWSFIWGILGWLIAVNSWIEQPP